MKILILSIALVSLLSACANQPREVPTNRLDSGPNIVELRGEIVGIEEVKKDASFGQKMEGALIGSLIGGQFGGGSGKEVAGVTGAFIGTTIAKNKYGGKLDHIFIETPDGRQFESYVHTHAFEPGDAVEFTLVSGHVSAIVLR